ncbi:unnamed protein product [Symbiodinium sp. CCMP2592]|nr:unnamed protein product [Symbiodinium sp. CCMP2592]
MSAMPCMMQWQHAAPGPIAHDPGWWSQYWFLVVGPGAEREERSSFFALSSWSAIQNECSDLRKVCNNLRRDDRAGWTDKETLRNALHVQEMVEERRKGLKTDCEGGMMPDRKRENGATTGSIAAHELDSVAETAKAAFESFHLSFEALPVLLQHLSVDDILEWLDRSASILEFSAQWDAAGHDAFDVEIAKDVKSESDVYDIISNNLRRDLFVHCWHVDASVAQHLVANHGLGGLPFVQQLIVEAMLGRMEDLLPESAENSEEFLILRALTKSPRQKWVSLLVRTLQSRESFHQDRFQQALISDLKSLRRAAKCAMKAARQKKKANMDPLTLRRLVACKDFMRLFQEKDDGSGHITTKQLREVR